MTHTEALETLATWTPEQHTEGRARLQAVVDNLKAREAAWQELMTELAD